jgi:hypothetical protein
MLTFAILTVIASLTYLHISGSSSMYISYLFIWPAIAAVYSVLIYLLPELRSMISNVCVFIGIIMVMAGSVWRGILDVDTVSSQYILYLFMGGMTLFLFGVVFALLSGAWKLRC